MRTTNEQARASVMNNRGIFVRMGDGYVLSMFAGPPE